MRQGRTGQNRQPARRCRIYGVAIGLTVTMVLLALPACDAGGGAASPTPTLPPPPGTTPSPDPIYDLDLAVSWDDPVEPPRESYDVVISLREGDVEHADWVVGDAAGVVEQGRLFRGGSIRVERAVDWSARPLGGSNELFYVHARGDDGSTFAQAITVRFDHPPAGASPTPTLSCGYASFALTTEADLRVEHPDDAFTLGIANRGILACGRLDWQLAAPPLQADALSCAPAEGELAGAEGEEPTTAAIDCTVDWSGVDPGLERDLFLVLFSYPAVNGVDTVHLVHVRAVR